MHVIYTYSQRLFSGILRKIFFSWVSHLFIFRPYLPFVIAQKPAFQEWKGKDIDKRVKENGVSSQQSSLHQSTQTLT